MNNSSKYYEKCGLKILASEGTGSQLLFKFVSHPLINMYILSLGVGVGIIIKWILDNYGVRVCTEFLNPVMEIRVTLK